SFTWEKLDSVPIIRKALNF
ncbi:MAG: hypothetical protein ABIK19_01460, partial [candidate division WOR-3 bacterium]